MTDYKRFRTPPTCGTRSGYDYHVRDLQEKPCDACREASSAYWKEQRIKRNDKINELRRAAKRVHSKKKFPRELVIDTYGDLCHICSETIDLDAPSLVGQPGWELSYHPDHVVPLSKGGADELDNIRPAHAYCNQRKWATLNTASVKGKEEK